jgi:hypothetical protein
LLCFWPANQSCARHKAQVHLMKGKSIHPKLLGACMCKYEHWSWHMHVQRLRDMCDNALTMLNDTAWFKPRACIFSCDHCIAMIFGNVAGCQASVHSEQNWLSSYARQCVWSASILFIVYFDIQQEDNDMPEPTGKVKNIYELYSCSSQNTVKYLEQFARLHLLHDNYIFNRIACSSLYTFFVAHDFLNFFCF